MAQSMTGYGAGEAQGEVGRARVEVRGVNARFLEVRPRLPAVLSPYEADLRRRIGEAFTRGRIDLTVTWEPAEGLPAGFRINVRAARAYLDAVDRLGKDVGLSGGVTMAELLALPGVVESERADLPGAAVRDLAIEALDAALTEMTAMRRAEGDATSNDVASRLSTLEGLLASVSSRAALVPELVQRRLQERVSRLGVDPSVDPARLAQEVAYLADRSDVAEEIARLSAHLSRAGAALEKTGEPLGKTLEFIAQEMHREANTIGSKTSDGEISGVVLAMKTEIERIREQAQNLE